MMKILAVEEPRSGRRYRRARITRHGSVLFEGIKSDTAAIKLLVLSFETLSIRPPRIRGMSPDSDPFQVEFRDVPLSH